MAAPTLEELRTKVRRVLGETTASFWTDAEIDEALVDGIRELQDEGTPTDALLALETSATGSFITAAPLIVLGEYIGRILPDTLITEESDGEYGLPWTLTSRDNFYRVRQAYGETMTVDESDIRLFCYSGKFQIDIYPLPVIGRNRKIHYIAKASESDDMTLPYENPNLCRLAVYYAIFNCASKKSRLDAVMVDRYEKRYSQGRADVLLKYKNKYGMSPAKVGYFRVAQ